MLSDILKNHLVQNVQEIKIIKSVWFRLCRVKHRAVYYCRVQAEWGWIISVPLQPHQAVDSWK